MSSFISVSGPWVTQKEIDYTADAAATAWGPNHYAYNERFEKTFARYLGVGFGVSLPSCTSALHLSLAALGIGPGDEVIVPEVTWIATAAPISYVGAIPVFADVDPRTWCMDADSLEQAVTERTKAIIPVDLYGGTPDWDAILAVAGRHGIAVIEDAAEAVGSEYHGRKCGSLGHTGCFSFHGSKTLTTGEGGMLVTDDEELLQRIHFLRDHGRLPGDVTFFNASVGFKYKMSALQAAFGLAQTERLEELVARKRQIFAWYQELLGQRDDVILNVEPEGTRNTYWMVSVVPQRDLGLTKVEMMNIMHAHEIGTRPFFHPLSEIPAFRDTPQAKAARERNPVCRRLTRQALNLPSGLSLTREQVQRVCETYQRCILDR